MTAMPSRPDRRVATRLGSVRLLWAAVALVAGFQMCWGGAAGLRLANDDLKFVRLPERELPLAEALDVAWRTQPSFRPLEVVMAHLSDPVSLSCPWVVPVQAAGLVALLLATLALARASLPGHQALWPVALLMVLLSPATTASLWQMDACSQTWSAALGAWSVWLAWRWIDGCACGQSHWRALAALCATMTVGLTVKENFYGWAIGLAAASAWMCVRAFTRDRLAAGRMAWVSIPVILFPLVHLACRWRWSALSGLMGGSGEESRYQAEFGTNLLVNGAVSVAGAIGVGPFHLVLDPDASMALRALPAVATCTVVGLILLGLGLAAIDRRAAAGVRWSALGVTVMASVGSLAATIPMPAVSELYGLGANVGGALLAVAAGAVLWRAGVGAHHARARTAIAAAAIAVAVIGTYGLVSRAIHFRAVWCAVRTLNGAIVAFQPTLPQVRAGESRAAGMVHVPTACLVGATHSQYVMPPLQVLDHNLTEEWLARRDPSRRVVFSIGTSPRTPRPNELVLDCAALPQHGHW